MSISDQLDKASAQMKGLSEKASAAEANANAAKAKDKAALEQRVDAAKAAAKQTSDDLKASAKEAKDETTQWWGQVQDNWKSHVAKVHKDVEETKANMKADRRRNGPSEPRPMRLLQSNSPTPQSKRPNTRCSMQRWHVLTPRMQKPRPEVMIAAVPVGWATRLTMSELGRIQRRNVGSYIRRTLCPRGRNGNLSTGPWRLCAASSAWHAEADRRACHCLSWMVVGPGLRLGDWVSRRSPAAGTTWKNPGAQAEDYRPG